MKKIKNIRFLLLGYLGFQYILTQCLVNPQPGENLWHLVANIGTAVDELAVYQDGCASIPLTISPQGTTISTAGTYCLTSDVILSDTSTTIALSANNIVLDLNSHTITGTGGDIGAAITVNNGAQEVTVRNGTIQNASSGIFFDEFSSMINVNNVHFVESSVTCTGCSNVIFKNLTFQGEVRHADFPDISSLFCSHIVIFNGYNCIVDSCISQDFLTTNIAIDAGAYIAAQSIAPNVPIGNITFSNSSCYFTSQDSNSNSFGGFYSDTINSICKNCTVLDDGAGLLNGFNFPTMTPENTTASGASCFISNCTAQNMVQSNGILINPSANSKDSDILIAYIIQNCNVSNCSTGIYFNDQSNPNVGSNVIIKNCSVNVCTNSGFLVSLTENSHALTQYCTATNCLTGFSGPTDAIFAFNTAANNTTNYNNTNGGAPSTVFTSNARLFGDNLYNT